MILHNKYENNPHLLTPTEVCLYRVEVEITFRTKIFMESTDIQTEEFIDHQLILWLVSCNNKHARPKPAEDEGVLAILQKMTRIFVGCLALADDTSLSGRAAGGIDVSEVVGEMHVAITGDKEVVQHPGRSYKARC